MRLARVTAPAASHATMATSTVSSTVSSMAACALLRDRSWRRRATRPARSSALRARVSTTRATTVTKACENSTRSATPSGEKGP